MSFSGGKSTPQVDAPTNGPGMPPPLANAGVNPTNINATQPEQPGQSIFGGKSVGTPETQEPYTPGAYDPGPVRSQQDRFQGYNVPTPNYAQFNQQVAQPLPGPVQPNVMPDNLPPGVEIGFGMDPLTPPNMGPMEQPVVVEEEIELPDGVEMGFGMPPEYLSYTPN